MVLWLVCDASGSMIEGGKRLIVRGLVRQVEQYFRLGYAGRTELKLVAWNEAAVLLPWRSGDEVPDDILACRDSVVGSALTSLLGATPGDRCLILTDGFWDDETRRELKRWGDGRVDDALRVIKTGADANPKLTGAKVFDAEDIFEALDGWLAA